MTVKEYQEKTIITVTINGKKKRMSIREHLDYLKQQREKQKKEQPL